MALFFYTVAMLENYKRLCKVKLANDFRVLSIAIVNVSLHLALHLYKHIIITNE